MMNFAFNIVVFMPRKMPYIFKILKSFKYN